VEHGTEFVAGLGADSINGHDVVGIFIFCVPKIVLTRNR
jgi:hypothetical protein